MTDERRAAGKFWISGTPKAFACSASPAEMMAFVRDGEDQCGENAVPPEQLFEVLALYEAFGKKAPLEDEIVAKQNELVAMKSKMGSAKWCALYRLEMKEADVIAKLPK